MSEVHKDKKRFILWNRHRDGELRYPDENSDGAIGRVSLQNVYLTTYANYPGATRPKNLGVGEKIEGVEFRLNSEFGVYDVYRVA